MPTLHSARIWLDLGIKEDVTADLATGDVVIVCVPAPLAGTVKSIKVVADIKLTTAGTLAVQKAVGAVDVSLLSAATVDLTGLPTTVNVAENLTLTSDASALHLSATDMLRATWTFTTMTAGEGFGLLVEFEPDTW